MKTISFTIISLIIICLAWVIKTKDDKISDVTYDNFILKETIAEKDSLLKMYHKSHLIAIELTKDSKENYFNNELE